MSVNQAQKDLVDLRKRVELLYLEVEDAERSAAKLGAFLELAPIYALPAVPAQLHQRRRTRSPKGFPSQLAEAVKRHIREQKEPQHTRTLLDVLARQGLHVRSVNSAAYLSALLSRTPGLRSSRQHGWWLTEWGQNSLRSIARR